MNDKDEKRHMKRWRERKWEIREVVRNDKERRRDT